MGHQCFLAPSLEYPSLFNRRLLMILSGAINQRAIYIETRGDKHA